MVLNYGIVQFVSMVYCFVIFAIFVQFSSYIGLLGLLIFLHLSRTFFFPAMLSTLGHGGLTSPALNVRCWSTAIYINFLGS